MRLRIFQAKYAMLRTAYRAARYSTASLSAAAWLWCARTIRKQSSASRQSQTASLVFCALALLLVMADLSPWVDAAVVAALLVGIVRLACCWRKEVG